MNDEFFDRLNKLEGEVGNLRNQVRSYLEEQRNALNERLARIGDAGSARSKSKTTGKRAELRNTMRGATLKKPVSPAEIETATKIPYQNIVQWIRNHPDLFKRTGKQRKWRYQWKGD